MDEVVLGSTLENERWRVGFGRRRGGSAEPGAVVVVVGILDWILLTASIYRVNTLDEVVPMGMTWLYMILYPD